MLYEELGGRGGILGGFDGPVVGSEGDLVDGDCYDCVIAAA